MRPQDGFPWGLPENKSNSSASQQTAAYQYNVDLSQIGIRQFILQRCCFFFFFFSCYSGAQDNRAHIGNNVGVIWKKRGDYFCLQYQLRGSGRGNLGERPEGVSLHQILRTISSQPTKKKRPRSLYQSIMDLSECIHIGRLFSSSRHIRPEQTKKWRR